MCGLAGILTSSAAPDARDDVARMLGTLRHRGPDGEGVLLRERLPGGGTCVLGHRRLSIIDLSPGAAQPMSDATGRLHLVFNGEIVNYVELRDELRTLGVTFHTASDTEVLLAAWATWGPAALLRLEGMFAFALLDERQGELVLARDPFGIKPLYYTVAGGRLAVASEIPALLALEGVSRRADPGPVAEFLNRGTNTQRGSTLFAAVREIPPACLARVSLAQPTVVAPVVYWRPPTRQLVDIDFAAAARELRERLLERVQRHLRSDVPLGLMLSGGLDSSSLLLAARHVLGPGVPIHTFSYRAADGASDEGAFQAAAREAAGAIGHDVHVTADEWAAELDALVRAQGEPFGSPVIFAQRCLFRRAAETGVKVVLEGQGADEYLAGYERFPPGRIATLLRNGQWRSAARQVHAWAPSSHAARSLLGQAARLAWPRVAGALRPPAAPHHLADDAWLAAHGASVPAPWRAGGAEVLRAMLVHAVHAPSIPWLMRYADRNAMAFGIENRVPFLDRPLVEWVLGLPERHFIAGDGRGKALLREAMRGVVPSAILDRRDRIGFDVPVEAWVARTPGLAALLAEGATLPPVNRQRAARLVHLATAGSSLARRDAFAAWQLVTLAAWQRAFGVVFE